jgi:hypothetical protein
MFGALDKNAMMMAALIAVIIGCVYLFRELKKTKKELGDLQSRPPVVISPPARRPAPAPVPTESDSDEIKPAPKVADEQ